MNRSKKMALLKYAIDHFDGGVGRRVLAAIQGYPMSYEDLVRIAPHDTEALIALLRIATRRGDYDILNNLMKGDISFILRRSGPLLKELKKYFAFMSEENLIKFFQSFRPGQSRREAFRFVRPLLTKEQYEKTLLFLIPKMTRILGELALKALRRLSLRDPIIHRTEKNPSQALVFASAPDLAREGRRNVIELVLRPEALWVLQGWSPVGSSAENGWALASIRPLANENAAIRYKPIPTPEDLWRLLSSEEMVELVTYPDASVGASW